MTGNSNLSSEEIIEKKAWICKGCGILIYHSKKPIKCSCGGINNFYNDKQMDSLIKREIQKALSLQRQEIIKPLQEKIEKIVRNGNKSRMWMIEEILKLFKEMGQ